MTKYMFREKLHDAVYGLALGDALGVPYEFMERGAYECKEMTGYGTHNQPAGTWSDDTSMTLGTLKSLKDNDGKVDIEDIRKNFLLWLNEEEFTAGGRLFDIGGTTINALTTGVPGTGPRSNGNGSLMRILPLAFTDCTDDEIRAVSAITHGHEISMEACVIYVHAARRLLQGEKIEDILPTLEYGKPFDRLSRLGELTEDEISTSGYVVSTLEAALWSLTDHGCVEGFRERLLRIVNMGDDTDTACAAAGGLLGIVYDLGSSGCDDWMEILKNKELIDDCIG